MNNSKPAQQGMCIENRYRIVREIAQGGMATVYQANDERLERPVAIKIMHTQLAQGVHREQFIARFRREAKSAAAIANPHIVQVYDTGEYEGLDYLVMEYVHGVNLRYEMNMQGTLSVKDTLRIVAETLDGLSSAHQAGVVHRDIKPENILINDRGHVQITDFGLARAISQATLSSTGLLLGTAAYLAPEMIEHNLATPQGDVYAVGMMAWEMLAGRVPFNADNPVSLVFKHVHENTPSLRTVCQDIDPEISRFIDLLTQRDMNQRPQDARAALDILRDITKHLDQSAWQYRLIPDLSDNDSPSPSAVDVVAANAEQSVNVTHQDTDNTIDIDGTKPIHRTDFSDKHEDPTQENPTTVLQPTASHINEEENPLSDFDDSNQPTIAINTHTTQQQPIETLGTATPDAHEQESKPRHKKLLLIVIILAVLASIAGGISYWYFFGPGSYWTLPQPDALSCDKKPVCNIRNISWKHYESTLKVAGIPYKVVTDYDDKIPANFIIRTNPATVGAHLSKHTHNKLVVTVSRGIRKATIPMDIADPNTQHGKHPIKTLKQAGFTIIRHRSSRDIYSLEKPEGALLDIMPKPGSTVPHNQPVTVLLSKGPMPVEMPDIINLHHNEAQKILDELKLTANVTEENSDTVEAGKIIRASENKGKQLHWGDKIDIVVSKGPAMITVPDVRGKSVQEAQRILEGLKLKVRISAPLGDFMHIVRFQSPGAGGQVRARDAQGNPSVVTLTVI